MSELNPCPFCGGEARPMAQHWDDGSHIWWVECRVCGAEAKRCDDGLEAIDAWNARGERTCRVVKSELDGQMWVYRHEFSCECGQRNLFTSNSTPPNHCPNCGAKVVSE